MFEIENKALWTIKMTLEQSQKIYNLTNKLTHSFGLKFEIFS